MSGIIRCEPDVIAAMAVAWNQSSNGTSKVEAGFRVDGPPLPGVYTIVPNRFTNERMKQTTELVPGLTTNVFHVHPNGGVPQLSPQDQAVANKYNVDIFAFSTSGLYEYVPGATASALVRSGMSWLMPCN
jgi:hypothetical protein